MKLGLVFTAFASAKSLINDDDDFAAYVAQRRAQTHHFADQLMEIVPDLDFGDIEANIAETTMMLAPLPEEELIGMMDEVNDFFDSILAVDFLAGFDA